MCFLWSKWFVNVFLHFRQKQVESLAVYILVCTTKAVWLLGVYWKLPNNKTVSQNLINPDIALLLWELKLVSALVSSSSLSIDGKRQTGGELSPLWWPSLPLHLPTAHWECSSCCWSSGGSVGWVPSTCWAWTCTPGHDYRSMVLHLSDLRAMFPKGLKSWSRAFKIYYSTWMHML